MLKQFRALPTEARVREMKGRDYLWCLVNTLLDREEELGRLCPSCRSRAMEKHCAACGLPATDWSEEVDNAAFDLERFEKLRGGELP